MATPHIVSKVPLKYCTSEFHSDSNCIRPLPEGSIYEQCRVSYSDWCPVCDNRSTTKPFRRRSRSECADTDPLKERNRLCAPQPSRDDFNRTFPSNIVSNKLLNKVKDEQLEFVSRPMDIDSSISNYSYEFQKSQKYDYDVNIPSKKLDPVVNELLGHRFCENDVTDISHKRYQYQNTDGKTHFNRKKFNISNETLPKILDYTPEKVGRRLPVINNRQMLNALSSNDTDFHGTEEEANVYFHRRDSLQKGLIRPLDYEEVSEGKRFRQRCELETAASQLQDDRDVETPPLSWPVRHANDHVAHERNENSFVNSLHHFRESTSNINCIASRNSNLSQYPLNLVPDKRSLNLNITSNFLQNGLRQEQVNKDGVGRKPLYSNNKADCDNCSESGDSKLELAEDSEEDDDDLSVLSSLTSFSSDPNTPLSVTSDIRNDVLTSEIEDAAVTAEDRFAVLPPFLRASLFSHVPPYIRFTSHDGKEEAILPEVQKHMKWKLSTITPLVIRTTVLNTGYRLVRKSEEWCGMWSKHMKSVCFNGLKDFQKLNHFPGTFQLGRKDRLWKNLYRLRNKFGNKEFGFIPRTYVLPEDTKLLRQSWDSNGEKKMWIVKPPNSARGTGIQVIHRWTQIPKGRPLVVQKYVSKPYLINGSKFDLRLYILVTSIDPLRIYIYDDGLVRFASVKYSSDLTNLHDRFIHLTNYSVNKLSSHYTHNEDASACQGHKWTIKTLWTYFEEQGINTKALWNRMVDLCIKTVISAEAAITKLTRANLGCRYNSYELFGIDILLDSQLKPWLLEVNISPSLRSSSPLDLAVKGPLVHNLMNLAGYQIPNKLSPTQQEEVLRKLGLKGTGVPLCFDKRLYVTNLSPKEHSKHSDFEEYIVREDYLSSILEDLTPDDVRHLIQSEDELSQAKGFVRIFPTADTHSYHKFFKSPRYYNFLLDAWEHHYHGDRQAGIDLLESLCKQKRHLEVPATSPVTKDSVEPIPEQTNECVASLKKDDNKKPETVPVDKKPSVVVYRAVRPRTGKSGVILRPFSRAVHVIKRLRSPASSRKDTQSNTVAAKGQSPKVVRIVKCPPLTSADCKKFSKPVKHKEKCNSDVCKDLGAENISSCGIEVEC